MNVTQRLKEIGREDYQGFLAEISDKWAYQMQQVNGTLSAMLFDCTIADLQSEFERYQPILKFDTMRDDFPIAEDVKAKQTQLI